MKIFVADGQRSRRASGYGMLTRRIIVGLVERGHDVAVEDGDVEWERVEADAPDRIDVLPRWRPGDERLADVVLQVATPGRVRAFDAPTLLYTQHALSRLPGVWRSALRRVDGVVVPSAYDARVFSDAVSRLWIAHQSAAPHVFRPRPRWREEGPEEFTFLFVGSYSWRKGVDILLRAFLEEFDPGEPVRLVMHCPGAGGSDEFAHLLDVLQQVRPEGRVRLHSHVQSPEWMCRLYNRADAIVTFSRGEGWCMPTAEALLCEKPVIAPASTGFLEYLDTSVARLVPTSPVEIATVADPFARSAIKAYGAEGISAHEVDVASARRAMRDVFRDSQRWRAAAQRGGERMRHELTWEAAAAKIERACQTLAA